MFERKKERNHTKHERNKIIRIICTIGFIIFTALLTNEIILQPWLADKTIDTTRKLYKEPVTSNVPGLKTTPEITDAPSADPDHDDQGRLIYFKDLLQKNEDTKGWITYPGTNIDYVVMQSDDPNYYLSHDFNKNKQRAGCLFLDHKSSAEESTKNLVIHGHNMKSTDNMFHYLEYMKKLNYFKARTIFTFNTLYQTGQWKVFSVFITNGSDEKEPFFDYTQSSFKDPSEFLNFIYQLRIRSIYNLDQVDINENDQICTLSTCSYEINNYRLVIVGRKVREGEAASMDPDRITKNATPLYPQSYYDNYGGKAPDRPVTFEKALKKGLIRWYKAPVKGK